MSGHFGVVNGKDEKGRQTLVNAARLVESVMKKRGWRVGTLEEFYPSNPGLLGLNMNHGEKIFVRLRSARSYADFLDFGSIVGTLLHELVHIVHGPHGAQFYQLLEEITVECENQTLATPTLSSFSGAAHTLGRRSAAAPGNAREAAVLAAERRRGMEPQRLGGAIKPDRPLAVLVAEAAERRRADELWCLTQRTGIAQAGQWACPFCTLINEVASAVCDACAGPRAGVVGRAPTAASVPAPTAAPAAAATTSPAAAPAAAPAVTVYHRSPPTPASAPAAPARPPSRGSPAVSSAPTGPRVRSSAAVAAAAAAAEARVRAQSGSPVSASDSSSGKRRASGDHPAQPSRWYCGRCTFLNDDRARECAMCSSTRTHDDIIMLD